MVPRRGGGEIHQDTLKRSYRFDYRGTSATLGSMSVDKSFTSS
jgi:hypothetical protein